MLKYRHLRVLSCPADNFRRRGLGDARIRLSTLLYGGPAETPRRRANVPTWLETVELLVNANIENHKKPNKGGGGGRGRGGGRRR